MADVESAARFRLSWRAVAIVAALGTFALLFGAVLVDSARSTVTGSPGPVPALNGPPPTTGTEFNLVPIKPYPDLPSPTGPAATTGLAAPDPGGVAGGILAARARVAAFVAALNAGDPDLANTFMCTGMTDTLGAGMLERIVPGSLTVGGVAVTGDTGTAFVKYEPSDASDVTDLGRAQFALVVEHGLWMLCNR